MEITKMSVADLSKAIKSKELSVTEVTNAYFKRIDDVEDKVGAYITLCRESALAKAKKLDDEGVFDSPLAGIPAGIKDNICTKDVRTTCASKMLENFVPPYDAHVMEQLSDIVMLGKLNMDEFAMGSTNETSYFKVTRNPADLSRVPGGSSGGSAAVVAAHEAAFALGSDTGGSIRQPAGFCGVVGVKPTYGSVSRYGLIAFASSLDQIGSLTRNVEDSAIVLDEIMGYDKRDATSQDRQHGKLTDSIGKDVKGMRVAIPKEFIAKGLDPVIREHILDAGKKLESLGMEVDIVSMPALDSALSAYYVISSAEASSNLSRFDGIKYGYSASEYADIDELYRKSRSQGFGSEVKRRIMLGSFVLSSGYYDAYYKKALAVRSLIVNEYAKVYKDYDVILAPVAPTTAYKIGEKSGDPIQMYMGDIYTVPVNIAGLPALCMPCGKDKEQLPIGVQIIGRTFEESTILQVGHALECELGGAK